MIKVHGEIGEKEKADLFDNLDERLEDCVAFIANGALTVGINPMVDFGKVFLHFHKGGALVRYMFQLVQRFGRSAEEGEGKLHDTVIECVVHDIPQAAKQAKRNETAEQGGQPDPLPAFEQCLREIRHGVNSTQRGNEERLKKAPLDKPGAFQQKQQTDTLP